MNTRYYPSYLPLLRLKSVGRQKATTTTGLVANQGKRVYFLWIPVSTPTTTPTPFEVESVGGQKATTTSYYPNQFSRKFKVNGFIW